MLFRSKKKEKIVSSSPLSKMSTSNENDLTCGSIDKEVALETPEIPEISEPAGRGGEGSGVWRRVWLVGLGSAASAGSRVEQGSRSCGRVRSSSQIPSHGGGWILRSSTTCGGASSPAASGMATPATSRFLGGAAVDLIVFLSGCSGCFVQVAGPFLYFFFFLGPSCNLY